MKGTTVERSEELSRCFAVCSFVEEGLRKCPTAVQDCRELHPPTWLSNVENFSTECVIVYCAEFGWALAHNVPQIAVVADLRSEKLSTD